MGCRCNERRAAFKQGAAMVARGDLRGAMTPAKMIARTVIEDARNGSLRAAAAQRLAAMRGVKGGR